MTEKGLTGMEEYVISSFSKNKIKEWELMTMNWNELLSNKSFIANEQEHSVVCRNNYDKIICSTLFRRLQDKAQVFPLDDDDYVRTRLTHSLEVSAIGKKLGEYVFQLLEYTFKDDWIEAHTEKEFADILLCAGLVHDIGNPPFGHFGEYAIREWFQTNLNQLYLGKNKVTDILSDWQLQDLYNFEGNAQSLRLLSRTPHLGNVKGFNLSYSILGAMMKYPISAKKLKGKNPNGYKKIGYYYSEKELFDDMNRSMGLNENRHPLSWLLEASDDIAYRTSDLEDAMVKKVVGLQQIIDSFNQYLSKLDETDEHKENVKNSIQLLLDLYQEEVAKKGRKPELTAVQRWNQNVQYSMIKDAGNMFVKQYKKIMQGTFKGDLFENTASGHIIQAISELSEKYIYTSSIKTRTELFGRRVVKSLLDQFMPAAIVYDTEEEITFIDCRIMDTVSDFYKTMYHHEANGKSDQEKLYLRILMITDYISGMTDNYAKKLYQELFV